MRPRLLVLPISLACVVWLSCAVPVNTQQPDPEQFELSGMVVNAVTGEPVGGALLQINTDGQRSQFSDSNGSFVFTKLPRGRYFISAKKPGYFNEQELGHLNAFNKSVQEIPSQEKAVLKLTPEAILYGEVKNESGGPLEGITVRAQRWQIVDGRRRLEDGPVAVTDDEGNYRIAELRAGSYRLSFSESNRRGSVTVNNLRGEKLESQGYGLQFYPGVSDPDSATSIELRAGASFHIAQTLRPQQLFAVSGTVHATNLESGFNVMLQNAEGDGPQSSARTDPKTGGFLISGVPAGTYLLRGIVYMRNTGASNEVTQPQTASQLIHVTSDVTDMNLTLGRSVFATVQVQSPLPADQPSQVLVRLLSTEFPQLSLQTWAPPTKDEKRSVARIEDIPPGTYEVQAMPNAPAYVASLRCGSLDLLREELTVLPGAALPPIEVTLRTDGAQLSVKVTDHDQPAAAGLLVYSQEFPRRSFLMQTNEAGLASQTNIPPGRYQVAALEEEHVRDLEFRNPAAVQKYLEHATEVTLQPGDKTSVSVELQKTEEHQ